MRTGKYILTIAFLALSTGGFAQKFNYNGMRFRVLTDSTVAVGNHHIPYDTLSYGTRPSEIPPQVGDIVIPTKVEYQGRHYAVTEIGDSAFMQCYDITSLEIPEGITKIGSYAFAMTYDIKEFIIPQSVRYIGESAFLYTGTRSIILPDTMDYIAKKAFYLCRHINKYKERLEKIKIPYGIQTITRSCFYRCAASVIEIPETVKKVESYGLELDSILVDCEDGNIHTKVICHAQIPPENGEGFFIRYGSEGYMLPKSSALYVPKESIEAYKSAYQWSAFQVILPIEEYDAIDFPDQDTHEVTRYALDGQKLSAPRKGLNIVKMSDGTTRKVFVK